jgi:hypothetical protein
MKDIRLFHSVLIVLMFGFHSAVYAQEIPKLRVLVLTDIEADPDDTESMIRFLTYSNQWDVEGLIATTSIHQKTRVAPESIIRILQAYSQVQPNLLKHEKGYPSYVVLVSKVKQGLPVYGMKAVGQGHDSEGSDWIVKVLEKDDVRPVWICVWGGVNTLAQALWKIKNTKSPGDAEKSTQKSEFTRFQTRTTPVPGFEKHIPVYFMYAVRDIPMVGLPGLVCHMECPAQTKKS